jgi:hypothetical protein
MKPLLAVAVMLFALAAYPAAASAQPKERDKTTKKEGDQAAAAATGLVCVLVWVVAGMVFYFAPTLIALLRGHPNMAPIIVVNFFLGWTLVGWVVALAWAFTAQERHRADYGRSRRRDDYD